MLTQTATESNAVVGPSPEPTRRGGSGADGPNVDLPVPRCPSSPGGSEPDSGTAPEPIAPSTWDSTEPKGTVWPLEEPEIRARLRGLQGELTYRAIAARVGMNAETVRRYLRGESRITAIFVARVAAAFGVDPAELLFDRRCEPRASIAERLAPIIEQLAIVEADARRRLGA